MGQENTPEENNKSVNGKPKLEKPEMRTSTKWAIGVTVVWLLGVGAYGYWKWPVWLCMEPNAIGDFLAGAFSPLAFFWLVAGYRQQGEELRLNTAALEAQLVELGEYVKSNQIIADSAKRQADISEQTFQTSSTEAEQKQRAAATARRREIAPNLSATLNTRDSGVWKVIIHNSGATANKLRVVSHQYDRIAFDNEAKHINNGANATITLKIRYISNDSQLFVIDCVDEDGNKHTFGFNYVDGRYGAGPELVRST